VFGVEAIELFNEEIDGLKLFYLISVAAYLS